MQSGGCCDILLSCIGDTPGLSRKQLFLQVLTGENVVHRLTFGLLIRLHRHTTTPLFSLCLLVLSNMSEKTLYSSHTDPSGSRKSGAQALSFVESRGHTTNIAAELILDVIYSRPLEVVFLKTEGFRDQLLP
jgi:hypothetical protein